MVEGAVEAVVLMRVRSMVAGRSGAEEVAVEERVGGVRASAVAAG
jgi:hypothetical protein